MNRTEFVKAVAKQAEVTQAVADSVVRAIFGDSESAGVIGTALSDGDRVSVTGFGNFEARKRAARTGRNPATGEKLEIPESVAMSFKPSKALKDFLNGN